VTIALLGNPLPRAAAPGLTQPGRPYHHVPIEQHPVNLPGRKACGKEIKLSVWWLVNSDWHLPEGKAPGKIRRQKRFARPTSRLAPKKLLRWSVATAGDFKD
jgi:hypothetical protein